MAQQGPLSQLRDIPYEMPPTPGGALAAAAQGSGSSAADILDGAAGKLMERYVPDYGNRAAGAGAFEAMGHPGSLASALGGGMHGRLEADLNSMVLPVKMEGEAAQAQLTQAAAEQARLQNEINRMNLGYLTEPMYVDEGVAAAGGEPNGGVPPGAGGQATAGGPGDQLAAAPLGAGQPPSLGQAPTSGDVTGQGDLPLTEQSAAQMNALKMQLHRALKFSGPSPQARADVPQIYAEMAKLVAEDPMAKEALAVRQKQKEADIAVGEEAGKIAVGLPKKIQDDISKMSQDAIAEATKIYTAPFASPDYSGIVPDPETAAAAVQKIAKQLMVGKYQEYRQQLKQQLGVDPNHYIGNLGEETPPQGGGVGSPGDGTDPVASADKPNAPAETTPPDDPLGGFKPAQLTPKMQFNINQEQASVGKNINTLQSGLNELNHALELNKESVAGPMSDWGIKGRNVLLGITNLLPWGKDKEDPVLNATAELQAVLTGDVLKNVNDLVRGNPTPAEKDYTEHLSAVVGESKGVRRTLIEHTIKLMQPRLEFEKLRMKALSAGKAIQWSDYEDWLKSPQGYGPKIGDAIINGKVSKEAD